MHDQPTPTVSAADVERVLDREFPPAQREEARAALGTYGTESYERECDRVRLAVLKLAGGDLGRLRQCVEMAKMDYRDVLLAAEYPGCAKHGPLPALSTAERAEVTNADWRQYQEWLTRG